MPILVPERKLSPKYHYAFVEYFHKNSTMMKNVDAHKK